MANLQALASTSASPSSNCNFDVFLNHRGPDTKKTLASHIYRRLLSLGFRVFLDQQELQAGENLSSQIEGVIATASIHIAIFSPRYAESKWCLDELLQMLKSGAPIIPVFCNVQPAELRHTRGKDGVYAKSLRNLERSKNHEEKPRYDSDTIDKWRNALFQAAQISGFELDACNGDEGELVHKIGQRVQKMVKKTPLYVATYPTGLREKVEDLEKSILMEKHRGKTHVAGIVGLGGIGKTTLAKEFFNRNTSNYDASCFLSDIREAAAKSSLPLLQTQLLKDLAPGSERQICSIAEGIGMLVRFLPSSLQALVILDDVDHDQQLEALLLPLKANLRPGSLILVTSRDRCVLWRSEIADSSIYKLTGLNREHSQELFCSYAFHEPHPPIGFEQMVPKFLRACHGLPLSLKVIGALLYGKNDLDYWKGQLGRLSKVLPTDIQSSLRISYDSLDAEEQEIFLDIACFFIGVERDTVIRIWEGCGWEGSVGFVNLEYKCLVDVDSKNCIRMHDHLRDMGRALADKKCPHRLWHPTDKLYELYESSVRGIGMLQQSWKFLGNPISVWNRCVDNMRELQLLRAEGNCLESIFSSLQGHSTHLIWLCWYNCPYSFLPSWLPLKKLRVLQLEGGQTLETLWQRESQAPLQLRELNINVRLLQLPKSIGQLKHLEKIELNETIRTLPTEFYHLYSLKHLRLLTTMRFLPNSFGNLTNLQYLDLNFSVNLQKLPRSFGNLTNLQYLDLSWSSSLRKLSPSFGNLTRLRHLNLAGCSQLTISTETFGNITSLVSLDLSFCLKMNVLPPQVARQRFLEEINLSGTNLRALPTDFGELGLLESLKLGSPFVKMLPPSLGELKTLKELTLFDCSSLKCLPDSVGQLEQLTSLEIRVSGIEYLPIGVMEMNNLETLKVHSSPLLNVPFSKMDGLEVLTKTVIGKGMVGLKYLELHKTGTLEVSFLAGICVHLQHLKIVSCNDLVKVGALPTVLVKLEILSCRALRQIRGLCGLSELRQLDISGCNQVEELPFLETLTSLEELRASECDKLKLRWVLAKLTKLRLLREPRPPKLHICSLTIS